MVEEIPSERPTEKPEETSGKPAEEAEEPQYRGPEFTELLTATKRCCDELGLGCDFTFGSGWPFGDGGRIERNDRCRVGCRPSCAGYIHRRGAQRFAAQVIVPVHHSAVRPLANDT
ncbi:MAG: hypothetical protein P8Z37_04455 [Acidobacteriota bacterium]